MATRSWKLFLVAALTVPAPYCFGGAVAVAPQVSSPSAADFTADAGPNTNPAYLQVYDANVENLPTSDEDDPETCRGDWHDLMYFMRLQSLKPDVYLVQQLNNRAQLDLLLTRMEEHFGEEYEGVLAENDPEPSTGHGECENYKIRQTNAVIWRADRLELVMSAAPDNRWQAQAYLPPPSSPDGARSCRNNDQARTKGVKALLHDKISGKEVTAASFHWRTHTYGHQCVMSNATELSSELTEDGYGGADLFLAGGDSNNGDSSRFGEAAWTPWYEAINGDLGGAHEFRDAAYAGCLDPDPARVAACLKAKDVWTLWDRAGGKDPRRIDFLLGRKPGGAPPTMTNVVVPTFDEGDQADVDLTGTDERTLDYSDHRAVGARVHY